MHSPITVSSTELVVPSSADLFVAPDRRVAHCPDCGAPAVAAVTVTTIAQKDGVGWALSGTGEVLCQCPRCGTMLTVLRMRIPVECASFDCPKCHRYETLEYRVKQIDADGEEFTFEADIVCRTCSTKRTLFQAIKNILTIKKLEVKADGISIER